MLAAAVLEPADQFLLLGVHRDHRLTGRLEGAGPGAYERRPPPARGPVPTDASIVGEKTAEFACFPSSCRCRSGISPRVWGTPDQKEARADAKRSARRPVHSHEPQM